MWLWPTMPHCARARHVESTKHRSSSQTSYPASSDVVSASSFPWSSQKAYQKGHLLKKVSAPPFLVGSTCASCRIDRASQQLTDELFWIFRRCLCVELSDESSTQKVFHSKLRRYCGGVRNPSQTFMHTWAIASKLIELPSHSKKNARHYWLTKISGWEWRKHDEN